jgi:hypothetical protein
MPPQDAELINLPTCLEGVKVNSMPSSAYYIADFISQSEEEAILQKVGVLSTALPLNMISNRVLKSNP